VGPLLMKRRFPLILGQLEGAPNLLHINNSVPALDHFEVPGLRFKYTGVLSDSACRTLRQMFDRNNVNMQASHNDFPNANTAQTYSANAATDFLAGDLSMYVNDPDFPSLLALRQLMLEKAKTFFSTDRISGDYTHFIKRVGHKANEGMGKHCDNCQFHQDHVCHKTDICCAWRSHTLFMYLSNETNGGEFFFAKDPEGNLHPKPSETALMVEPKCGTIVGFSAGAENPHGVMPLREGNRYAVGLWLTQDGIHTEQVPSVTVTAPAEEEE